jgi:HlyD family secretion protein
VAREVDLAVVARGDIQATVDQDGKTRIRERYVVSAPLAGRLLRIEMKPGDPIVAGETLLASIEPRDPDLLDARTLMQAEANVQAAQSNLERMTPLLEEALAQQELAESELARARSARAANPAAVSTSEVETKLAAYRTRSAQVRSARHAEEIARFELQQARAALLRSRPAKTEPAPPASDSSSRSPAATSPTNPDTGPQTLTIRAPINGRVLRVFQESSGYVSPGAQLLQLGDPRDLEVEVDVLSTDAVRIRPGADVRLEHWGGDEPLHGRVRLVEPSAFTKLSTLGVEEQRVNVIVDLEDPPEHREALGDGFRVEARIVVAEAKDVLRVPTSALFRVDDQWAVFRHHQGRAQLRKVQLGVQNDLAAEVRQGLQEGDQVVVHPGDLIDEGTAIRPRD